MLLRLVGTGLAARDSPLDAREAVRFALPGERQLRFRVRRLAESAPPPERWATWLRRRGAPTRISVHRGVLARLRSDPRVRVDATEKARGGDISTGVGERTVLYVGASDVARLVAAYRGEQDPERAVVLMAGPDEIADALGPDVVSLGPVLALVDGLESIDARERHAAVSALARAWAPAARALTRV